MNDLANINKLKFQRYSNAKNTLIFYIFYFNTLNTLNSFFLLQVHFWVCSKEQ